MILPIHQAVRTAIANVVTRLYGIPADDLPQVVFVLHRNRGVSLVLYGDGAFCQPAVKADCKGAGHEFL